VIASAFPVLASHCRSLLLVFFAAMMLLQFFGGLAGLSRDKECRSGRDKRSAVSTAPAALSGWKIAEERWSAEQL
jgi:hypothetical protein